MMADNHPSTKPTDRLLQQALESRWAAYRRSLHHADQAVFDQLFEHASAHADASEGANQLLIDGSVLVSMLIEQQKQLDDLEDRLDYLEADLNSWGRSQTQ